MPALKSKRDYAPFLDGARTIAPSLTGACIWALVTGIAMGKSVLTLPQAMGMSLFVFAGSSQLAVLPLIAAKAPIWTVLMTSAIVSARFVVFSAGLAPHFSHLPFWKRLLLGYFNSDLSNLHFMKRDFPKHHVTGKEAFFWGLALSNWLCWHVFSVAGILLTGIIPSSWDLGLAGTLALVPILISAIDDRTTLAAVSVAGVAALCMHRLPDHLALSVAVVIAVLVSGVLDKLAPAYSRLADSSRGQSK
jgi:predicted branched-subunit amino acid permease